MIKNTQSGYVYFRPNDCPSSTFASIDFSSVFLAYASCCYIEWVSIKIKLKFVSHDRASAARVHNATCHRALVLMPMYYIQRIIGPLNKCILDFNYLHVCNHQCMQPSLFLSSTVRKFTGQLIPNGSYQ